MYLFKRLDCGMIGAGKRSGKSNLLAYMMVHADNLGYRVYSNMTMKGLKNFIKLDSKNKDKFMSDLEIMVQDKFNQRDFSPVFLGIDEFPNILHAQLWKEGTKWSKLFDQLGKANITCFITCTHFDKVYNGFRDTCNVRIICEAINQNWSIAIHQKQSLIHCEEYLSPFYKTVFNTIDMRKYYDTYEVMYL